jgi:hypothetical protein
MSLTCEEEYVTSILHIHVPGYGNRTVFLVCTVIYLLWGVKYEDDVFVDSLKFASMQSRMIGYWAFICREHGPNCLVDCDWLGLRGILKEKQYCCVPLHFHFWSGPLLCSWEND